MHTRQFLIAALLLASQPYLARAGEPVVRGSLHTIHIIGNQCLSVPKTVARLRPGTRLEMRVCQDSPEQTFEWNVVSFEIKYQGLCLDALRAGDGQSQPGDPVGLWYCQQTPHQQWFLDHKSESWLDAFNIVGGGNSDNDLCLSITDANSVDGAPLTVEPCDRRDNQWFRLYPTQPGGPAFSKLSRLISVMPFLAQTPPL